MANVIEKQKRRLSGIDAVRLLGAFCVILLHINPEGLGTGLEYFRCFSRFAVPFFFVVAGFFYERSYRSHADTVKRIVNILKITVVANLFYFFWALATHQIPSSIIQFLVEGFSVHLWFLHSMILGYLIIGLIKRFTSNPYKWLGILSFVVICMTICFEDFGVLRSQSWAHMVFYAVVRNLWAVAFMYCGMILAVNEEKLSAYTNLKTSLLFFIATLVLLVVEIGFHGGAAKALYLQMYMFLPFVVISLFAVSYNVKDGFGVSLASELGRKYSLFIYLFHMPLIKILSKLFEIVFKTQNRFEMFSILLAAVVFIFTLLGAVFLDKYINISFNILTGKFRFPRKAE